MVNLQLGFTFTPRYNLLDSPVVRVHYFDLVNNEEILIEERNDVFVNIDNSFTYMKLEISSIYNSGRMYHVTVFDTINNVETLIWENDIFVSEAKQYFSVELC